MVAVGQDVDICLQPTAHSIARSLGNEKMFKKFTHLDFIIMIGMKNNLNQLYGTLKTPEVTLLRGILP